VWGLALTHMNIKGGLGPNKSRLDLRLIVEKCRRLTVAEIYITFRGIFPNLDVLRGVRRQNLVRSTRLVELSSPVSLETLAESTEACQLRPKRPF